MKKYKIVGMGGTFDHMHAGHQAFLKFAASLADEIWVGVTTNELTRTKKFFQMIEPFETRSANVTQFLAQEQIPSKVFPLADPCGPTLQGSPVEAIIVTELTKAGGDFINQCRVNLQLLALPIEVCELLRDQKNEYLSSTRIRQGLVNRQGQVYSLCLEQGVMLNDQQKAFFREKRGQVVLQPTNHYLYTYVVGDMVLETFIQNNWPYQIGVYDGFNQRQMFQSPNLAQVKEDKGVANPAGQISREFVQHLMETQESLFKSRETIFTAPFHVRVHGEEDLGAVILALVAPLGAVIYYGQPNEGIIEMIVTEELKEQFYSILCTNIVIQPPESPNPESLKPLPGGVGLG